MFNLRWVAVNADLILFKNKALWLASLEFLLGQGSIYSIQTQYSELQQVWDFAWNGILRVLKTHKLVSKTQNLFSGPQCYISQPEE